MKDDFVLLISHEIGEKTMTCSLGAEQNLFLHPHPLSLFFFLNHMGVKKNAFRQKFSFVLNGFLLTLKINHERTSKFVCHVKHISKIKYTYIANDIKSVWGQTLKYAFKKAKERKIVF